MIVALAFKTAQRLCGVGFYGNKLVSCSRRLKEVDNVIKTQGASTMSVFFVSHLFLCHSLTRVST